MRDILKAGSKVQRDTATAALQIGIDELIAFKAGINQAAKHYNLPPLTATLQLIDDIKKYNKIDGLKKEVAALYLQKYALDQACSRQSQSLINLAKLKSYGITEDRILQLNNFLGNNEYKDTKSNSSMDVKYSYNQKYLVYQRHAQKSFQD
jgi:hypothetical protein